MQPGVRGPYRALLFSGLPQLHESFGLQKSPYKRPGLPGMKAVSSCAMATEDAIHNSAIVLKASVRFIKFSFWFSEETWARGGVRRALDADSTGGRPLSAPGSPLGLTITHQCPEKRQNALRPSFFLLMISLRSRAGRRSGDGSWCWRSAIIVSTSSVANCGVATSLSISNPRPSICLFFWCNTAAGWSARMI